VAGGLKGVSGACTQQNPSAVRLFGGPSQGLPKTQNNARAEDCSKVKVASLGRLTEYYLILEPTDNNDMLAGVPRQASHRRIHQGSPFTQGKGRVISDPPHRRELWPATDLSLAHGFVGALGGRIGGILVGSRLRDCLVGGIDLIL